MSLYRVAVLGLDEIAPFELGVLCEVFGTDRSADGFPSYEFAVCSPDGAPIRTRSGFGIVPDADLGPLATADLVAVPAHPLTSAVPPAAVEALVAAAERGAWILSVCSGAFLLGQAGLLDGRRCTTHWKHAALLAERYPTALVSPNELYVQDGRVITSAGTAAGIDACLHLVRQVQGAAVATKLARRMVVPPHRAGGQSQFIEAPIPEQVDCDTLQPLLEWLVTHLDEPLTVDDLAARTHMAPRTFARRFRAETGATPHDWLTHQRLLLARRLLEETDLSVESVATRAGFGDSATLRHHFRRRLDTTPADYRHLFRSR
ncbi:helix-turn-helix domain-containing protein [Catellatospora sp. NPDC049133]|jgi:transcriptional regulator GlxA family with amidase domain|uniref:GlxA family transcriptional regulator n=1 Tax=Catellatospora sp. NPDC049133 TaxID=3155499 RepID=UPI0033E684CE